jgi:PleD family two-component response regulator
MIRKCDVDFFLRALLIFRERRRERGTMGPSSLAPRVFVVDDGRVTASTLTAILKIHGFSATFFTSPLEALTAARLMARDLLAPVTLDDP